MSDECLYFIVFTGIYLHCSAIVKIENKCVSAIFKIPSEKETNLKKRIDVKILLPPCSYCSEVNISTEPDFEFVVPQKIQKAYIV